MPGRFCVLIFSELLNKIGCYQRARCLYTLSGNAKVYHVQNAKSGLLSILLLRFGNYKSTLLASI